MTQHLESIISHKITMQPTQILQQGKNLASEMNSVSHIWGGKYERVVAMHLHSSGHMHCSCKGILTL